MTKFCIDCKWVDTDGWGRENSRNYKCGHPRHARGNDKITGDVLGGQFCSIARDNYACLNYCGPDAKYFEPKVPVEVVEEIVEEVKIAPSLCERVVKFFKKEKK